MRGWSRVRRGALVVIVVAATAAAILPFARAAIAAAASLAIVALIAAQVMAWSGASRPAAPSAYERALERPEELPDRPPDLVELERTLGWGSYSRHDFDHRVRPVLERLHAYKQASSAEPRRAILDDEPLEPPASATADAGGRIDTATLARLIDRIEAH